MTISETSKLYRQRSELWFNNAKWNYQAFYSIYRSRGIRKFVIPVGIIRSERVKRIHFSLPSVPLSGGSYLNIIKRISFYKNNKNYIKINTQMSGEWTGWRSNIPYRIVVKYLLSFTETYYVKLIYGA